MNEGQGILKARNNSFEAPPKTRNNLADSTVNLGKGASGSPPNGNSRNNSIEEVPKCKVNTNLNPVQLMAKTANELAKINQNVSEKKLPPVAPPPRKSSDPTVNKQKVPPNKIPPAQIVTKENPIQTETGIVESSNIKHENSNGTATQNIPPAPTPVLSPVVEPKNAISNEGNQNEQADVSGAESNGVGDKIRKFERAAEDATGRTSRPGSVRNKVRNENTEKNATNVNPNPGNIESGNKKLGGNKTDDSNKLYQTFSPTSFSKWRKEDHETPIAPSKFATLKADGRDMKADPKDRFPKEISVKSSAPITKSIMSDRKTDTSANVLSATPNVQPVNQTRTPQAPHKERQSTDEANAFKTCKFKPKEKCTPAKAPSGYFSRGTEEIWMVKKKDIEEIEDRVLGSFIRASSSCVPPANAEISRNVSFAAGSNATLGRTKRVMYARSESLDPQWAGSRSQTLKRQSSVACTCGHDKKNRSKTSGTCTPVAESSVPPRPRSRSHGDDHSQGHVLDKYETLV